MAKVGTTARARLLSVPSTLGLSATSGRSGAIANVVTMATRPDTQIAGDEREMLDRFLDAQRATVVVKAKGLDDADAARRLVDSATTVSGVVRHLADVERSWFAEVFADLPYDREFGSDDNPDGEWDVTEQDSLAAIIADYEDACEISRGVVAEAALDDRAAQGPVPLRWIMLHMIEETAPRRPPRHPAGTT